MKTKAIVIFGGTGDLAYRKLFPALYDLDKLGKLQEDFQIIGIGRRDYSTKDYIDIVDQWAKKFSRLNYNKESFEKFSKKISYYKMNFTNIDEYEDLCRYFDKIHLKENIMYYYAVSPEFFEAITKGLSVYKENLKTSKVIVEKPFGKDLESAKELNYIFKKYLENENIYYIDHYLGKEMLLNIMTIRFFNTIFSGVWNRNFIDNIQINVFETVGVETRGGYYDKSGAIADMLQNHLLQILSVVAMDEPATFEASDVKDAQINILKNLRKISDDRIDDYLVLGQYEGYQKEDKVSKDSTTETYVAMKLFIDNERWQDVPFYLRTGKKLHSREIEIIIQFRTTSHAAKHIIKNISSENVQDIVENNVLVIKIQPDEGINLKFNIKKPGTSDDIDVALLDYCQSCKDQNILNSPWAYERLLEAGINSNRALFSRWEQIELSWQYMNDIVNMYKKHSNKLYLYKQGSKGPIESEDLLKKDKRKWLD